MTPPPSTHDNIKLNNSVYNSKLLFNSFLVFILKDNQYETHKEEAIYPSLKGQKGNHSWNWHWKRNITWPTLANLSLNKEDRPSHYFYFWEMLFRKCAKGKKTKGKLMIFHGLLKNHVNVVCLLHNYNAFITILRLSIRFFRLPPDNNFDLEMENFSTEKSTFYLCFLFLP